MFSQLRQGSQLFILEKNDPPTLRVGQVVSVSNPMPRYNTTTPNISFGMQTEMVVDIRAKSGEQDYDFKQVPSALNIAPLGNAVISDSREAMLSEVDNMDQASAQVIESVPYNERVRSACKEMYKTLNPNYAMEQARDEAISNLSERLDVFEKRVGQTLGNIEKLLSKGGK